MKKNKRKLKRLREQHRLLAKLVYDMRAEEIRLDKTLISLARCIADEGNRRHELVKQIDLCNLTLSKHFSRLNSHDSRLDTHDEHLRNCGQHIGAIKIHLDEYGERLWRLENINNLGGVQKETEPRETGPEDGDVVREPDTGFEGDGRALRGV